MIDRFLEDATEVDVDALADTSGAVLIAGIMEHIEEAGVHSGDSSCVLPATSLSEETLATIRTYTEQLARALNVIGLMNIQYAVKDGTVYVLEVNPRASRTVPYVGKATGVPLPKIAVGLMLGKKISGFYGRHGRSPSAAVLREVAGVPVQQVPGRGSVAGAGDALDGRSDGRGREFRRGVRQGAIERGDAAAGQGPRVLHGERSRQAGGGGAGEAADGARLRDHGHARYGQCDSRRGDSGERPYSR